MKGSWSGLRGAAPRPNGVNKATPLRDRIVVRVMGASLDDLESVYRQGYSGFFASLRP